MTRDPRFTMTADQRLAQLARNLRQPRPWIPGSDFNDLPGLAEHLADAVEQFRAARAEEATP